MRRVFAVVGGLALLGGFGFLVFHLYQSGGIMEFTASERTGYDQLKTLFLLLTRMSMFLLLALALIAWGFAREKIATIFGWCAVAATFLNIVGMIILIASP